MVDFFRYLIMTYYDPKNNILLKCNVNTTGEICLHIPPIVSENIKKKKSETTLLARTMDLQPKHLAGKIHIGISFLHNIWMPISWSSWDDFVVKANRVWKSYFPAAPDFIKQEGTSWTFSLLDQQTLFANWGMMSLLNPATEDALATSSEQNEALQEKIINAKTIGNPSLLEISTFLAQPDLTGYTALKANPIMITDLTPVLQGPGNTVFIIVNPNKFIQLLEFEMATDISAPGFNYIHLQDPYNKLFGRLLLRNLQEFICVNTFVTQYYREFLDIQVKDGALVTSSSDPWTLRLTYSLAFTGLFHKLYIPDYIQQFPHPGQFLDRKEWLQILLRIGAPPLAGSMEHVILLSGEPTPRASHSFYTPPFTLELLNGTGKYFTNSAFMISTKLLYFTPLGINAIETIHFDRRRFGVHHRSILCTMNLPHHPNSPYGHPIKFNPGVNLRSINLPQSLLLALKDSDGRSIELSVRSIIEIEILNL